MSRARKLLRLGVLGGRATEAVVIPDAFLDTFTAVDGTLLAAHTPDTDTSSNGWTDLDGAMQIVGGKAMAKNPPTVGELILTTADVGLADGVVQATLEPYASLAFRTTDTANWWMAWCAEGILAIDKLVDGAYEEVDSVVFTPADPNAVTLTVTLAGDSITVVADNDPASTVAITDAFNQSATQHGLMLPYDETSAADNFSIAEA